MEEFRSAYPKINEMARELRKSKEPNQIQVTQVSFCFQFILQNGDFWYSFFSSYKLQVLQSKSEKRMM